jgi:hypothetical protein
MDDAAPTQQPGQHPTAGPLTVIERLKLRESHWKRILIALGIAIVLFQGARIAVAPRGDFRVHWELGRRFAAGDFIYQQGTGEGADQRGHDYPYPPFWGMAHAPLSLVSTRNAQVAVYPLAIVSLLGLFVVLQRLSRQSMPLGPGTRFWMAVVVVVLASRFLLRDLVECGVNLALVAMSWYAVDLWSRRREWLGGFWLGLAVSLKCTPALFVAYFLWKRQWRMVAASSVAIALFTLSPALWMGPTEYGRAVQFWFVRAWDGVGQPNPSIGVLGEEPIQNISLKPSLARFLMHLPEGHRLKFDHPWSVDVLNLSPVAAGWAIKGVLLVLLAGVAWRFRAPVTRRTDPVILWECATVSLLILLFSPITWGQHCVGVIPVIYLIVRSRLVAARSRSRSLDSDQDSQMEHQPPIFEQTSREASVLPSWISWPLGAYVFFVLILNRSLVGKELSWLLDNYHVFTWCILGLVLAAVGSQGLLARRQERDRPDARKPDTVRLRRAA